MPYTISAAALTCGEAAVRGSAAGLGAELARPCVCGWAYARVDVRRRGWDCTQDLAAYTNGAHARAHERTSCSVMDSGPVMLNTIPVAWSTPT